MTIPQASFIFSGLGSTKHYLVWGDTALPTKTTDSADIEAITNTPHTGLLSYGITIDKQERAYQVWLGETFAPSKTTAIMEKQYLTRDKAAAFQETFNAPTEEARAASLVSWGDKLMESIHWATDTIVVLSDEGSIEAKASVYGITGANVTMGVT